MQKLKAFADKNLTAIITLALATPLILYAYGCESHCRSLLNRGETVTRLGLQAEVQYFIAQAEERFAALNKEDAFKKALFDQFMVVTTTGTVNAQGILTALVGALGIGAIASNVKLRVKLNGTKKDIPNAPNKKTTA